jgi:5-methylcytosine-specific restriction endonuclease McrA
MSLETRQKISKSNMGKKRTPEAIEKTIATYKRNRELRGGPTPAEQRHYEQLHPSGPDHWNWKGGVSKQRDKEFNSPEYKAFRQAVLKRDKYICQHCGARNGLGKTIRLKVHHIKSYAEFPELRFEVSNGVTLCKSCHDETKRGKPRNKRKDFVPTPRICEYCGREYSIRNPRKYCPDCRKKICCPVCGSISCHHSKRKALPYCQASMF